MSTRALILARRARFVASALGALGLVGTPAQPQPRPEPRPPRPVPSEDPRGPDQPPRAPLVKAAEPAGPHPTGPTVAGPSVAPTSTVAHPVGLRCPDPAAVSPSARARAQELVDASRALERTGHSEQALARLRTAYELGGSLELLPRIGKLALVLGPLPQARAAFERYFTCSASKPAGPERLEVEQLLRDLRQQTGQLAIALDAPGTVVHIEGEVVATTPTVEPVFLLVGTHRVVAMMPDGRRAYGEIDVGPNARLTLTMAQLSSSQPEVCLSVEPCLSPPHPCLSPPPPEPWGGREGVNIGLSVAPYLWAETPIQGGGWYGGGCASVLLNLGVSRSLELRLAALIGPGGGTDGFVMPVGGTLSAALGFSEHLAVSTGLTVGYLLAPEPSRSAVDAFEPSSSVLVLPELSPIVVRLRGFEIEPRIGLLLSTQQDLATERFGWSYLSTSIWLTYLFVPDGGEVEQWDD